ncbi:ABC transporter substrate-binding protein [Halobaculum sp. MBLA0147]|uniref:ABC transporter substrate-binding protein n=1 Tax=Halobaculum sp. MBLA0147 TaxID=3079934 RepID=UPI003526850E
MTRRRVLGAAGAVVGTGLAGCSGTGAESTRTDAGGGAAGATGSPTATAGESEDGSDGAAESSTSGTSYEACIEPVGCVEFASVPETWVAYNGGWADMAFALGQADGFRAVGNAVPRFFYEPFDLDLPAAADTPELFSGGWDEEVFYELDPDVILMDPEFMHGTGWDGSWDESDTRELQRNVAPFFGNNCRRRREFHDYELYTLYEAFERLADAFQQRERYEAFAAVHEEVQSTIQSRLPPASERPSIGLLNGGSSPQKGQFFPLDPTAPGYETKPYRDLGVGNAFPASATGAAIDYERLLAVDPEILVIHWGIGRTGDGDGFSRAAFREQYVEPMEDHPVGSQLTAVENRRVYPGAYGEQGPITNLLQTEMTAQQLFPEAFGKFDAEAFPAVASERRLFDRGRVREIVRGEI